MKVIKDWSTVIKMGKLLKMETFSRLYPGPEGKVILALISKALLFTFSYLITLIELNTDYCGLYNVSAIY